MKQSEQIDAGANDGSPLPRFLRGLFRGHRASAKGKARADAGAVEEPKASEPSEPAFAGWEQPPKILVVDDDAVILKTMGIRLVQAGCQVVTAHDGPGAIATARTEHPDLIVLDIGLPPDVSVAWDGLRVMQWIKRLENGEAPPVIIITGSSSPALRQYALDNGAAAFFQKPVDNEQLIGAIRAALENDPSSTGRAGKHSAYSVH